MKKTLLFPCLLLLASCSNGSNTDLIANYTNKAPNDIQINMVMGFEDDIGVIEVVNNDVYLKYEKEDEWYFSFFAELENGAYTYYQKTTNNGMEWEDFDPGDSSKGNPNSLSAISALIGATNSMFYDIFNIAVANGTKQSGTAVINGKDTVVYNVGETAYWINEEANLCMKIATAEDVSFDWRCEVKSYKSIRSFSDSPSL